MPRRVTKMCWTSLGGDSGEVPVETKGNVSGDGKGAEAAEAVLMLMLANTVPGVLPSVQDVLLTPTLLTLPLKKPLKQPAPQPERARQRKSTTGRIIRRTFAVVSVAIARCILDPTSEKEVRIPLPNL